MPRHNAQLRLLKAQIAILRARIPTQRIILSPAEKAELLRIGANPALDRLAAPYMKRPRGRRPHEPRLWTHVLQYRAESWEKARRVILVVRERPEELLLDRFFLVTSPSWRQVASCEVLEHYRARGKALGPHGRAEGCTRAGALVHEPPQDPCARPQAALNRPGHRCLRLQRGQDAVLDDGLSADAHRPPRQGARHRHREHDRHRRRQRRLHEREADGGDVGRAKAAAPLPSAPLPRARQHGKRAKAERGEPPRRDRPRPGRRAQRESAPRHRSTAGPRRASASAGSR